MKSRMDKYQEISSKKKQVKRTNKNQELYDDFYTNTKYMNLDQYEDDHIVDLSSSNLNKREDYHKVKDYKDFLPKKEIEAKEELKEYLKEDQKVYDINKIIANAKKNRKEIEEEKERKRKLRNSDYNIFEGATLEELKERKQKIEEEKEKIDEMINTISSEKLRNDIDNELEKDLFSDLMPTKTKKEALVDEVNKLMKETEDIEEEQEEKKEPTLKDIDRSFYTKSMDLSDADFEMDDELEQALGKNHTFLKILLFLILVAVIAVALYLLIMRK